MLELKSITKADALALLRFRGFGHHYTGFEVVLLLVGVAFAGVIVWAIQRSGRRRLS